MLNDLEMTIDELIVRSARAETSRDEERRLNEWRSESAAHEKRYQEVRRIHDLTHLSQATIRSSPLPASEIIHQAKESTRTSTQSSARGSWRRRNALIGLAAAAAGVLVAVAGYGGLDGPWTPSPANNEAAYVTGPGERKTVTIADGILVHMAPSTRVELIRAEPEPELWVEGRAFFGVPHQDGRHVLVRTSAGTVTVVGTRFDLRSVGDNLQLMVVEGGVSLSTGVEDRRVRDGELGLVNAGALEAVVRIEDPYEFLAWMGPAMVFQATPLERVAQEIESRFDVEIEIADPSVGSRTITTAFDGEELDEVINILCSIVQVQCTTVDHTITVKAL